MKESGTHRVTRRQYFSNVSVTYSSKTRNMTTCTRIIVALVLCQLFLLQANARTPKTEQQPAPLSFIENKGQLIDQHGNPRSDLDYKLSAPGISVFVGDGAIHYQWTKTGKESAEPEGAAPQDMRERLEAELKKPQKTTIYRLDVELVGANKNAVATSAEQQAYVENYYLSQTGPDGATAHSFTKLTYKNIYPHIDWVLYTKDGSLKYDFIVHPGGKPSNIKLKFEGATALSIKDGALTATTPFGSITEEKPYSYNS